MKVLSGESLSRFNNFSNIYQKNGFGGKVSKSGPGSDLANTQILREKLLNLLQELNIKIFIDAPCGDFNYMKEVIPKLNLDKYWGIDIVPEMISRNNQIYGNGKISFICKDIVEDLTFKGDLLLCRDCLVHLSFESTLKIIKNFINSDINYFLITTFINKDRKNYDYSDGVGWYPINLLEFPFNLPQPMKLIDEECFECKGEFKDKSLGLWSKEQLKDWYVESK
jgi:hypothetical protein